MAMELLDRLLVTLSELVVHELADDETLADARRSHNNDPVSAGFDPAPLALLKREKRLQVFLKFNDLGLQGTIVVHASSGAN